MNLFLVLIAISIDFAAIQSQAYRSQQVKTRIYDCQRHIYRVIRVVYYRLIISAGDLFRQVKTVCAQLH